MSTTTVADPLVRKYVPTPPKPWNREAFQSKLVERLRAAGGSISGSIREIGDVLGFKDVATRRIQSALWHLTQLGVLMHTKLAPEGLDSPVREHFYRLVRP